MHALWGAGESEAKLRQLFTDAAAAAPAILFIDEIDAIAPKRESAQREMERRIVAQMLTCMDDLLPAAAPAAAVAGDPADTAEPPAAAAAAARHVVVIGATNRPDALDAALRRAGRFDREIALGIPSEAARRQILAVLCRGLRLGGSVDIAAISRATPGCACRQRTPPAPPRVRPGHHGGGACMRACMPKGCLHFGTSRRHQYEALQRPRLACAGSSALEGFPYTPLRCEHRRGQ